ncbi:MAG: GatB/YqeY domain-containing protein [Solirubrobacterales bacterium]
MSETILDRVQSDTREAMKAGERERVSALRLVADALQKDVKEGGGDELAVLRRERKRRLEAADAYREGGSSERAAAEEAEAREIERYLPAELGDDELAALVDEAIAESGADGPGEMGKAMGVVMAKVAGRADGKRVSALVRERLAGAGAAGSGGGDRA